MSTNEPSVPVKQFFCPCCGSQNTRIAELKRHTFDEKECEPVTVVNVWCYNCSDAIDISVVVPQSFQPAPDIGEYSVMRPLVEFLKNQPE